MGRGRFYSPRRALVERTLRRLYVRDWPAWAWSRVPRSLELRVHRETLFVAPPGSAPLRIGFVSDLHIGPTTPNALLERAFSVLAGERLDVLALGGDYVFLDATHEKARRLERLVEGVGAPRVVAVLGNHDLWTHHELLEAALERAGARVLVNEAVRLDGPHDNTTIVGIDDPWTGRPSFDATIAPTGAAEQVIAISHSPEGLPLMAGRGVSLMLCGHTHGGHIALPGPRPVIVPGELGRRYPYGRFTLDDGMEIIVSRGVGGIELPVRLFAPPDVIVVDLVAGEQNPN